MRKQTKKVLSWVTACAVALTSIVLPAAVNAEEQVKLAVDKVAANAIVHNEDNSDPVSDTTAVTKENQEAVQVNWDAEEAVCTIEGVLENLHEFTSSKGVQGKWVALDIKVPTSDRGSIKYSTTGEDDYSVIDAADDLEAELNKTDSGKEHIVLWVDAKDLTDASSATPFARYIKIGENAPIALKVIFKDTTAVDPSEAPTSGATDTPSEAPTSGATDTPSETPTSGATDTPSETPTSGATDTPSEAPSDAPSEAPSEAPSTEPSTAPSTEPSTVPSTEPSTAPSTEPSTTPSLSPSTAPTNQPSKAPDTLKKGDKVAVKDIQYEVTKSGKSATVTVKKLPAKMKKASKVTIPASVKVNGVKYKVTSIGANVLKGSKAKTIVLGKNITSIAKGAFANCKNLKSITVKGKLKTVSKGAFKGCKKTIKVKGGSNKVRKANIKKLKKSGYKKFK